MSNFIFQDIHKERELLIFHSSQLVFKNALVPYRHCLAEPTPSEKLQQDTLFQIVDVRDTSVSVLSLIEDLTVIVNANESFQDHSKFATKAPRVPRVAVTEVDVNETEDDSLMNDDSAVSSNHIYRLTLQDCFGNTCYAYENGPLGFLRGERSKGIFRVQLGSKLFVRKNARVSFNALHLKNEDVKFLNGFIKELNYKLYERKLKELKEEINYEG